MNIPRLIQTLEFAGFKPNGKHEHALSNLKGQAIYIYSDKNLVKVWPDLVCPSHEVHFDLDQTTVVELLEAVQLTDRSIITKIKELIPTASKTV